MPLLAKKYADLYLGGLGFKKIFLSFFLNTLLWRKTQQNFSDQNLSHLPLVNLPWEFEYSIQISIGNLLGKKQPTGTEKKIT